MSDSVVTFEQAETPPGVRVVDHVEDRRLHLRTNRRVAPERAAGDDFPFPVDAVCAFATDRIGLDRQDAVNVRRQDGTLVEQAASLGEVALEPAEYLLELSAPVKLYVVVEGAVTVTVGTDSVDVTFDGERRIRLGGRSYHEQPATTVTTTEDPRDLMRAVSTFPSALKTTRPERSYPTLRGHPPLVELGDELDTRGLEPPDTGVTIEVPPEHRYVHSAAPLAYYLGAEVVPGEVPRIVTDRGFEHRLTSERWFEDEAARVLRQVLTLDAIVRTEGFYGATLFERRQVESYLPFDVESMYDRPLASQLAAYLQVPYEVLAPAVPRWCLTAYVPPTPAGGRALPYAVDELGIVRVPRGERVSSVVHPDIHAGRSGLSSGLAADGDSTWDLVEPETKDDSIEHAWFGDHIPIGVTKATVAAYRNELARDSAEAETTVTVVSNDGSGAAEGLYNPDDGKSVAVESRVDVGTAELRDLLTAGPDFLHFVGDANREGLVCPDGTLAPGDLDAVGIEAFLLEAPHSYEHTLDLVERGAVGGVGTIGAVDVGEAGSVGGALARLLNLGFPLRAALELVREQADTGNRYITVGDGGLQLVEPTEPLIFACDVERVGDRYSLAIDTYPTRIAGVGSTMTPSLERAESNFLMPGRLSKTFSLSREELEEYLTWHFCPIRMDGNIYWNDSLDAAGLD